METFLLFFGVGCCVFPIGLFALLFSSGSANRTKNLEAEKRRLKAIELSSVDSMSGIEFEHYVAKLLEFRGYTKVVVSKGSGDMGVDIVAEDGEFRYAIQVKRQSSPVSRRAVSDAVAGKNHYGCNCAMVITNGYLSQQALDFAETTDCAVIQRSELGDWIRDYQSKSNRGNVVISINEVIAKRIEQTDERGPAR